ncbi:hypothetical protein CPB83DRAFT_858355 [Crepidotus variabilis]|uniref:F-box domain-containing protein n=1 Tax=Crepidotus variabilis TaxID=179855 RepID=A0A9P6EBR1_9AGAR|nr:hypothetical protein CPB83DRAFT_858355 [Crepidotus variabilis]
MTRRMALQLPNETLEVIFGDLPPATLAILSRVSDRFNGVAERLLYTSPVITDVITPTSPSPVKTLWWCNAMQRRGREYLLQTTVKKLCIRWQTNPGHQQGGSGSEPQACPLYLLNACEWLGEVLPRLVGLESLEIWLGPANLLPAHELERLLQHPQYHLQQRGPSTGVPIIKPMHAIERVLWNCRFPYLRSCSLGAEWKRGVQPYTPVLTNFLSTLASLRHLRVADLVDRSSLDSLSPNQLPPCNTLTQLNSFRGPAGAAASLIPGRPVQYLALTGHDSDLHEFNLERMTRGSVPLKSLDLSAMSIRTMLLQNISLNFGCVETLRVRLALRHTLHFAESGIRILTGLSRVLSAFSQLSHLDLSPTGLDAYGVGRTDLSEELGVCKEWSRACPTLRKVTFPSLIEWVLIEEAGGMEGSGAVWKCAEVAASTRGGSPTRF